MLIKARSTAPGAEPVLSSEIVLLHFPLPPAQPPGGPASCLDAPRKAKAPTESKGLPIPVGSDKQGRKI